MHTRTTKRGFTLIELIVVIFIIGLLASIVIASLSEARKDARDNKRIAHLEQYKVAFKLYVEQNGALPDCTGVAYLRDSGFSGSSCAELTEMESFFNNFFGGNIPTDPLDDGSDDGYVYVYDSEHVSCDSAPILAAREVEGSPPTSWETLCSDLGSNGGLNSASNPYVIRLDQSL